MPAGPSSSESAAAPSTEDPDARLAMVYPGARELYSWTNGHAHSGGFATTDSPEQVKACYRRYAAQSRGYKLVERGDSLMLDGSAAMGIIRVEAATTKSAGKPLRPAEKTVISFSRP